MSRGYTDEILHSVLKDHEVERFKTIEKLYNRYDNWQKVDKEMGTTVGSSAQYKWYNRKIDELDSYKKTVNNEGGSNQEAIEETFDDLPDYGYLEPTHYISDLDQYQWNRKYAPDFSQWERLDYLEELETQVWNKMKLLVETARDHGKTWTMIKLFVRWLLEKDSKVIVIATQAKKDEIYQAVVDILESEPIRRAYGDVIERKSIRSSEIWFVDELSMPVGANFSVHGSQSYVTGLHADGGWLHLEDIVQEMKVSDAAEKRLRKWFKRTVRYIRGIETKLTATGTRKDLADFYGWLKEEFYFPLYLQKALEVKEGRLPTKDEITVDHELELITDYPDVGEYEILGCPNYPLPRLLYEFIFHSEDAEAELNNNPLASRGDYFDAQDWIEVDMDDIDAKDISYYIFMDPAFGKSETSSKTAILVLGLVKKQLIIVDAFIGRLDFNEKEEIMQDFYHTYGPLQTWLEDNFLQISRSFGSDSFFSSMQGLHTFSSTSNKKERIGALKYPFLRKQIMLNKNCPFGREIRMETSSFSLDASPTEMRTKFNALDTLSMGYLKLRPYLEVGKGNLNKPQNRVSNARRIFG